MNLKNFSLKNRYCLITGAAGMLGIEHAKAILEAKGNLILTDISLSNLKKNLKKLKLVYPESNIEIFKMDVTKLNNILKIKKIIIKKKIYINILINNAAIDSKINNSNRLNNSSSFENFKLNEWNKQVSVGLTGAMLCSQVFGNLMAKKKGGVILNIASDLSIIAPNQNLYNFSKKRRSFKPVTYSVIKHGLIGLTKYVATYWPTKNVRCNAISPGGIENNQGKNFLRKVNKLIPLNRMAKREEYRSAIQFLCSDASSYMTGQNIIIDGGRSIW